MSRDEIRTAVIVLFGVTAAPWVLLLWMRMTWEALQLIMPAVQ